MRRLVLLFALSGLFATIAMLAKAQQSTVTEPIEAPTEMVSLRTENSETYDNHNGTYTMKVFSKKKYYKENDTLKELNFSAIDEQEDIYTRAVRTREYTYRYDHTDKSRGYSFSRDSYYVKYIPTGDWKGKTSTTTPTENGVKEEIIFTQYADLSVSWKIITNAAVSFSDGVLTFTDSDDTFLFRIPAAFAVDSAEQFIPVAVSFTGDSLSYTLTVPENATWPVILDPSTEITANQDGRLHYYENDTYQNVRDHTGGVMINNTLLSTGQWYNSANTSYYVFRGFASFPIPDVFSVEACTLYVNGNSDLSTDDFDVYILGASDYGPTLLTNDFLNFDGQQSGSAHTGTVLNNTWNTSSYSSDWNTLIFNTSGIDSVETATGDTLWIAMISRNDYDNTPPTGSEYVYFESSAHETDKPYLSITYTPSKIPYNFTMTALDSTTIACSWNHEGNNEDIFYIINQADSSIVDSTTVDALADTVSGLDWNTQYVWAVAADSSGTQWISEPDSAYTLTGPPSDVSFFDYRSSHFSMSFDNSQNPDSTKFAVRIVINSDTLYWNDALSDTTTAEYAKTAATWGDSILIGGNGFLDFDTVYSIGIHGQNADSLWSDNWYSVKTSEEPSTVKIYLAGSQDKLSEFRNQAGITDYGAARSVAGSDSINTECISPQLGQLFDSSDYFIKRFGFEAVLPEGYEVRAGSLFVFVTSDSTDTDFDVTAFEGDWDGDRYDDEAFWNFDGRQIGTTAHNGTNLIEQFNTSDISANNWYYWTYNDNGLDILTTALGDTLRNTIISARDSSAVEPSGKEFFTIDPDSSYMAFSVDLPDTLPGNLSLTPIAPDSIHAEWTDRNHSEKNYLIVNLADSSAVSDTLNANTENTTIGGLSVNTKYTFMLKVLGGNLNDQYSNPDSTYTHANVPGKPSLYFAAGDVQDESGCDNNGVSTNVVFRKNDRVAGNHAYGFNGTSSYIISPDTTDFDFTDNFTLSCRIKRTGVDTTYNRVITFENSSEEASYRLLFNDNNQLCFQVHNGSLVSTGYTPVLSENVWYHIAGTFEYGVLKIYIDGDSTNVVSATSDYVTLFSNRILSIGRSPAGGSTYFNGYLDDIRIFNRALTSTQIDSLYNYDTFDDYTLGLNIVINGDMESDSDWGDFETLEANERSSEQFHGGSYSRKITYDIEGNYAGPRQYLSGYEIAKPYELSGFVRGLDIQSGNYFLDFAGAISSLSTPLDTWLYIKGIRFPDIENRSIFLYLYPTNIDNAGKSFYVDDFSVKFMDFAQSSLKLYYTFDLPDSLMIFTLNPNNNPSYTRFAVQDSVSGYYIDASAEPESLSTQPLGEWGWRTYEEWGAALGDSLSGITPGNIYVLRAKARNGE
ncbi:LamG domain-containing protein [Candidatus Latescibacterota bacterium]